MEGWKTSHYRSALHPAGQCIKGEYWPTVLQQGQNIVEPRESTHVELI